MSLTTPESAWCLLEKCLYGILNHSVTVFQYLCECQFDDNLKFKNIINEEDAETMRLQPIGRDKDGLMYWYQLDQDHNVRMYIEEQDDQDGSSWKCIVRYRIFTSSLLECDLWVQSGLLLKENWQMNLNSVSLHIRTYTFAQNVIIWMLMNTVYAWKKIFFAMNVRKALFSSLEYFSLNSLSAVSFLQFWRVFAFVL